MLPTIFCPGCNELLLDQAICPSCSWKRPVVTVGTQRWTAQLGGALTTGGTPVIVCDHYCVPADNLVIALDLETGAEAWRYDLHDKQCAAALATYNDLALVSAEDKRPIPQSHQALTAIDGANGRVLWRYETTGHSLSMPVVSDGTAFFSSANGLLHAITAESGQARWVGKHPNWGPAAPAIGEGLLCVGGRGEQLFAYDPRNGMQRWTFSGGGWFATTPVIAAGRVFAQCWDRHLYALDAASGAVVWKRRSERGRGYSSPPVIHADTLYIGDRVHSSEKSGHGAYALVALDTASGAERWRLMLSSSLVLPLWVDDDLLLFVSQDGSCLALDPVGGAEYWRFTLPAAPAMPPVRHGDMVALADQSGTIYALQASTPVSLPIDQPEAYLQQGDPAAAAVAYALGGNYQDAAKIYEHRLDQPANAARLYERAKSYLAAAALWERLGEPGRARDAYEAAGDKQNLGRILLTMGALLPAARAFEAADDPLHAAEAYAQAGERKRAAELYRLAGRLDLSQMLWAALGAWEQQVDDLIVAGDLATAAAICEREGAAERAAETYERAGAYSDALRLRVRMSDWAQVAVLANRLGDHLQCAQAYEQMGQPRQAAMQYEQAAADRAKGEPGDEENLIGTLSVSEKQGRQQSGESEQLAAKLRLLLIKHFNESELQDLCLDLDIDYEALPGQGKADKPRELVLYAKRHGKTVELLTKCQMLRPNVDWPIATPSIPSDPAQAAELALKAAQLYDLLLDQESAQRCRKAYQQYAHLPDITVEGRAEKVFVEYEWNTLLLALVNVGAGPAYEISLTLEGRFEGFGRYTLAALAQGETYRFNVRLRSMRDEYGPQVPLDVAVAYRDAGGTAYTKVESLTVSVTRQGDVPERRTPLSVKIPAVDMRRSIPPAPEASRDQVALTLRFVPERNGATIIWEADVIGRIESSFQLPYDEASRALVAKAIDALQWPGHPHQGPRFSAEEQSRLENLGLWRDGRVALDAHQLVGRGIYDQLIADPEAERALSTVRNYALARDLPVALVLRFPPSAAGLAALPWELLRDERGPLLLSQRQIATCVRYLDLSQAIPPPIPAQSVLRILAIMPYAEITGSVRERARAALLEPLRGLQESGKVLVEELREATPEALVDRLQSRPPVDIVHFYGHGRYTNGRGALLFDRPAGGQAWIEAERLASILAGVRLVVLHACQSALTDTTGILSGVAPSLSAAGVPAIIGMQTTIRAQAAERMIRVLYRNLAAGASLQQAIGRVRQALYVEEDDGISWFVPTLTIRSRDLDPIQLLMPET